MTIHVFFFLSHFFQQCSREMALHILFLHTYFKGNRDIFLAHLVQGKWQYISCIFISKEMALHFCTLISREMTIHFLHDYFKGNCNKFLAPLFQGKRQYISFKLISLEMAVRFFHTSFRVNGNTCTLMA